MSIFQKRTLLRSTLIGLLRVFFAQKYLYMGWWTSISGFLTVISLGLRIGRKQEGMGTIAMICGFFTFVSVTFGSIPVYTAKPSLDAFYATKFPTIYCIQKNIPNNITLGENTYTNTTKPSSSDICSNHFPIYIGQMLSLHSNDELIIDLGDGSSIYLMGPIIGLLQKNSSGYIFSTNNTGSIFAYSQQTISTHPNSPEQLSIAYDYTQAKRNYLQKNYPRVWEHSPWLTKIAFRKMKILGLFNREFNEYRKNLEFYLYEITT